MAPAHLFCWATEKYLPAALDLVAKWGFRYVLTMVWHKPGGFQPHDLPQYNCEFISMPAGARRSSSTPKTSTCATRGRAASTRAGAAAACGRASHREMALILPDKFALLGELPAMRGLKE
jgi:hypothetical protein